MNKVFWMLAKFGYDVKRSGQIGGSNVQKLLKDREKRLRAAFFDDRYEFIEPLSEKSDGGGDHET